MSPLRPLIAAAFGLIALALAGCGFTPLYAEPGVGAGLSSVEVIAPDGRVGFLIREDLDDALARDRGIAPVWRLEMTIDQSRTPRGLRADDTAARYELDLKVTYRLIEIATGAVARTGMVTTQVSSEAADQPYAAIAASEDVQARAANEIARKIRVDLGAWLSARNRP